MGRLRHRPGQESRCVKLQKIDMNTQKRVPQLHECQPKGRLASRRKWLCWASSSQAELKPPHAPMSGRQVHPHVEMCNENKV